MDTQIPNENNSPIISKPEEEPQEMLDQGEHKDENNCLILLFKWIHQILLWVFIIGLSISINSNVKSEEKNYFTIYSLSAVLAAAYIVYVVLELKCVIKLQMRECIKK